MSILNREALMAAASSGELPRVRVEVPELGGFVWVRGMSGIERDAWEKALVVRRRDGSVVCAWMYCSAFSTRPRSCRGSAMRISMT